MKAIHSLSLALILSTSLAHAAALTIECGTNRGKGVKVAQIALELDSVRPTGENSGSDWAFYASGKEKRGTQLKVVDGPRHRRGIDGYEIRIRKGAGPLAPRTVYEFSTLGCDDGEATVQIKTGAGTSRDRPKGEPLDCDCKQ